MVVNIVTTDSSTTSPSSPSTNTSISLGKGSKGTIASTTTNLSLRLLMSEVMPTATEGLFTDQRLGCTTLIFEAGPMHRALEVGNDSKPQSGLRDPGPSLAMVILLLIREAEGFSFLLLLLFLLLLHPRPLPQRRLTCLLVFAAMVVIMFQTAPCRR